MGTIHWPEIVKYTIEFVIFFIILKEINELKKHAHTLEKHETKLDAVRPLISTLYTETNEILELAVQFTKDAKVLRAIGTIGTLSETEKKPVMDHDLWVQQLASVAQVKREYIATTLDFIQSGRAYIRVMNLLPQSQEEDHIWELWANVKFFARAMEDAGARNININIYHHPGLVTGKEDFHYRSSDKAVIIRVGGTAHKSANSAIAITDSRVVERFSAAHASIIEDSKCVELTLDNLHALDKYFSVKDFDSVYSMLGHRR